MRVMSFWLMKSEPDEFSIDDLAAALQSRGVTPEQLRGRINALKAGLGSVTVDQLEAHYLAGGHVVIDITGWFTDLYYGTLDLFGWGLALLAVAEYSQAMTTILVPFRRASVSARCASRYSAGDTWPRSRFFATMV